GTLAVTAGVAGHYITQTNTTTLPLVTGITTDNTAQALTWTVQGEGGTGVLKYRVTGTSTWSTIAATSVIHEPPPTGGGGAPFTTFSVSFASLAAGNYDVEVDYTASGASSTTAVTTGTMTVTVVPGHYVTQTTTTTINALPNPQINNSAQTLSWDMSGAAGTAQMKYRLSGNSAWTTLPVTALFHEPPPVTGAGGLASTTYTASFAGLGVGTYDIEIDYTAFGTTGITAEATGSMTITVVPGHYETQTTQTWVPAVPQGATFADLTPQFVATTNANAGAVPVSMSITLSTM